MFYLILLMFYFALLCQISNKIGEIKHWLCLIFVLPLSPKTNIVIHE